MLTIFIAVLALGATRYTASHFAFCFLVLVLALWSTSSTAAYFAFHFLSVCIVIMFKDVPGDKVNHSYR